jgi:hypothetical protein
VRIVLAFLFAAAALQQPRDTAPAAPDVLVGFRFDTQHVVATVKSELSVPLPQLARDPVPMPIAKYGYPIFDLPAELRKLVPSAIRAGDRWAIHTAPGQAFGATAEKIVLGEGGCSHLIGVLLKVDDRDAHAFAGVRARYFAVERGDAEPAASELGELPASTVTPGTRATIDKALAALLERELPAVRAESRAAWGLAASEVEDQRTWARGVLDAQEALARGAATLAYDAQPYRLDGGAPLIFVRAVWRAAGRQAFAAAVWLRADTGEIVWQNMRPAMWIGMREFRRGVVPEQLGLVLNVVDRDRDGRAEILFAQLGYESVGISLLDSRTAFQPVGAGYSYGC